MVKIQVNSQGKAYYTSAGKVLLAPESEVQLTRVSDDNGNEIGTHYMNFEDNNGNKFKVIVLDEQYRTTNKSYCSNTGAITNMPMYNYSNNIWWYNAKETATENTQLILDWCSTNSYTSAACEYCRSLSFTINDTTYYGQFPNMREMFDIMKHREQIDLMDTSVDHDSSIVRFWRFNCLSSTQLDGSNFWYFAGTNNWSGAYNDCGVWRCGKTNASNDLKICPVLEIPL